MSVDAAMNGLILKIHSTVIEPSNWEGVIDELSHLLKADRAMLFSAPTFSAEPFWNLTRNMDPGLINDYAKGFFDQDEWLIGAHAKGRESPGIVSTGEQLLNRTAFLQSTFYNELLVRYGMDRFINVCLRGPSEYGRPPETALSLYREPGKDAFDDQHRALLGFLAPHLVVAIKNLWQARSLSLRTLALTRALDQVTIPLYSIDALGRLVDGNRAAEAALVDSRCLVALNGRLIISRNVLEHERGTEALRRLRNGIADSLVLTDANGEQAMLVTAPLGATGPLELASRVVGFVWIVPLKTTTTAVTQLGRLFSLSAAEVRVLEHLVAGEDLRTVAAVLHLSVHTIRNELKAIFRKTGRRSQGELIALTQRMSLIQGSSKP
jgi:DNA-binding CsgD family transcriptional regulator